MLDTLGDTKWEASGNLHSPQAINIPAVCTSSQSTRKGSFYGESSPEMDNQPFYKRF
jgi:hypothetical protein